MFTRCKTSKDQGNIGLSTAISYFTEQCIPVSLPIIDNLDYDLLIDLNGEIKRVQVKTTKYIPNKKYVVHLDTTGSNGKIIKKQQNTKYDLLFILTNNRDKYLIPKEQLQQKGQIVLGDKYKEYKIWGW